MKINFKSQSVQYGFNTMTDIETALQDMVDSASVDFEAGQEPGHVEMLKDALMSSATRIAKGLELDVRNVPLVD